MHKAAAEFSDHVQLAALPPEQHDFLDVEGARNDGKNELGNVDTTPPEYRDAVNHAAYFISETMR